MDKRRVGWAIGVTCAALVMMARLVGAAEPTGKGWPTYGGGAGAERYSQSQQITTKNVGQLAPAWEFHTGSLATKNKFGRLQDFEATPVLLGRRLLLATPFDVVFALDAGTGRELWRFDPKLPDDLLAANYTSRGVATWVSAERQGDACAERVFLATLDARLIAIDAATGQPCHGFGQDGQVDLKTDVPTPSEKPYRFFGNTSPPTVVGDTVVVGSAVGDNQTVDAEPGYVRGFDARTSDLKWKFDPTPWARTQQLRTGGSNTWGVIAADPSRDMVFLPTGSPSPDFFGGMRPGDDRDANSVVALRASTGERLWGFQLVHHDLWDYDVAAEPLLLEVQGVPAVAAVAKTGMVFVLNRLTGLPILPVEERAVPKTDVAGEIASPTQPFSTMAMTPLQYDPERLGEAGEQTGADLAQCREKLRGLRYEGVYTPPGLRGTLQYPGSLGGVNWSGMGWDPESRVLYANTNGSAYEIRLIPQEKAASLRGHHKLLIVCGAAVALYLVAVWKRRRMWPGVWVVAAFVVLAGTEVLPNHLHLPWSQAGAGSVAKAGQSQKVINSPDAVGEISPQRGTPYRIYRRVLQDDQRRPCTPTPWGSTVAMKVGGVQPLWRKPLGSMPGLVASGTVNFGAPVVTAGGLLFTAASQEPVLRAMDKMTGDLLWQGQLPVPAQSTPMTYEVDGRQFVVVDAGGHGGIGTPLGDIVMAFALQRK